MAGVACRDPGPRCALPRADGFGPLHREADFLLPLQEYDRGKAFSKRARMSIGLLASGAFCRVEKARDERLR